MAAMNNASDIIEALGGTFAVARELDIAPSTVSSWKQSGTIPKWRLPGIAEMARQHGVALPQPKAA